MRTSLKCLVFYLIVGVILLNLYFIGQLYFHYENNPESQQHQHQDDFSSINEKQDEPNIQEKNIMNNQKNSNQFLVLDWTGHQHIFREEDPIKCKLLLNILHICCLEFMRR